jgi:hypothetical protein
MDPELMLLVAQSRIALAEMAEASGLTRAEIVELVEYGAFAPQGRTPEDWTFPADALLRARAAARLRDDFELEPASLALLLAYRERIDELEALVRELECQLLR